MHATMIRALKVLMAPALLLLLLPSAALGQGYGGPDGNQVSPPRPHVGASIHVVFRGFRPLSRVTLSLFSVPIRLGAFDADTTGEVAQDLTLPPSAALGAHHVVAEGIAVSGDAVHAEVAITIVSDPIPEAVAFTGANTSNLLALAGLLITVGLAGMASARRRLDTDPGTGGRPDGPASVFPGDHADHRL